MVLLYWIFIYVTFKLVFQFRNSIQSVNKNWKRQINMKTIKIKKQRWYSWEKINYHLTFSWVPHSPCKSFPVQGLCWKCRLPVVLCNPEATSGQALLNSKFKNIHIHTGWPCTCWSPILSLLSWSWRSRDIHSFSVFCLYYNQ